MKNSILLIGLVIGASIIFTSCDDDSSKKNGEVQEQNIVELAISNGFNSLAAALTRANLVDDLQGAGTFTVFAPTDEAFDALLTTIGQTSIDQVPVAVLEKILLYHVIDMEVPSEDISAGSVTTLEGSDINLATEGGITINGASVISPFDVNASNGIIHTIDAVLVPSEVSQFVNTVLEPAYFSNDFTKLISASVKADVVETLLTTPDLTIFAPDNAAFEASGIDPAVVDAETLLDVLTYHVVGSKVLSTGIPREAPTVNGSNLYFSLVSSGNFINGNTEIVAVDIESGSGVVHVINQVLLPPAGNLVETAVGLANNGQFASLVAALQRTADEGTPEQNLLTVLSGDGPFTVFAPTDAAFQALLDSNSDWSGLGDIPLLTLIDVLTYHVVPARAYDKDLAGSLDANSELPTAFGQNIRVNLSDLTINSGSSIVGINTHSSNGVIHVIDNVLLPQSN